MDKIYLIEFDNGCEYEDQNTEVIMSCGSEEQAKSIVKEIYDWYEQSKDQIPSPPEEREKVRRGERSQAYQDEWTEYARLRVELWSTCPYGGEELGWKAMEYIPREKQNYEDNKTFYYVECQFIK